MALQLSSPFLRILPRFLREIGAKAPSIEEEVAALMESPMAPMSNVLVLLDKAGAQAAIATPGLKMASLAHWDDLGEVGSAIAGSLTLEETVARYLVYERLFYGANMVNLVRHRDQLELVWHAGKGDFRLMSQLTIGVWSEMLRQVAPGHHPIELVRFPHSSQGEEKHYEAFFSCPVLFDQPVTSIAFKNSMLGIRPKFPLPEPGHTLFLGAGDPFLDEVDQHIRTLLPECQARLGVIAERMAVSSRTMQRRLNEIDESFRERVDKVRAQMAYSYLKNDHLPVQHVSLLLGYSEQSAFNLAFRRWSGMSPSQWRESDQ